MVTSSGTSSASAARASRAASSSRQPPLMRPIGAPSSGTSSRAPGRRYDEPRTETTVASATRAPRAWCSAAALSSASISLTARLYRLRPHCRHLVPSDRERVPRRPESGAARPSAPHRRRRSRVVSARRDRPLRAWAAAGRGAADEHRRGRRDHAARLCPPHACRSPRRRVGPFGRLRRGRRGADGRARREWTAILEIDRDNLVAVVQPGVLNADLEGSGRQGGPLLRARSGELRVLLHRRQHRHQRRRAVLREVRRHARRGARARGRAGGRSRHPHRRPQREGRGRLLADPSVRRLAGNAGDRDRGNAAPAPGARRRSRRCSPSSRRSSPPARPCRR